MSTFYDGGNRKDAFLYGWDLESTRMPYFLSQGCTTGAPALNVSYPAIAAG